MARGDAVSGKNKGPKLNKKSKGTTMIQEPATQTWSVATAVNYVYEITEESV